MIIKKDAIATNIKTDKNMFVVKETDLEIGSKIVLSNNLEYVVKKIINSDHILVE